MNNAANTGTETLKQFNVRMADQARELHDRMHAAGHPVTPEEAKFLMVAGWAALGESVGVDTTALDGTLRRLAAECR